MRNHVVFLEQFVETTVNTEHKVWCGALKSGQLSTREPMSLQTNSIHVQPNIYQMKTCVTLFVCLYFPGLWTRRFILLRRVLQTLSQEIHLWSYSIIIFSLILYYRLYFTTNNYKVENEVIKL